LFLGNCRRLLGVARMCMVYGPENMR
jgi:hypothetical protein